MTTTQELATSGIFFAALIATAVSGAGIPPNFGTYHLDPVYDENAVLGWAEERIVEHLGRGLVVTRAEADRFQLSWRLLQSDPDEVAFNVYRSTAGGAGQKLNAQPITATTDFSDTAAAADRESAWWVVPVIDGREQSPSARATLPANAPVRSYQTINLRDDLPVQTGVHKIMPGDLNGDGEYDYIVYRPRGVIDPSFRRPSPDTFKVEAYLSDGTFLWRRDLGPGITLGVWFAPFLVYDFNGDGRAEVALKMAEGEPNEEHRILSGPEWLSVWDGTTGEEIDRVDWIARGDVADWGDTDGNRVNRNLMAFAYLDGRTPSILIFRGTYGLMKAEAWWLKDGKLNRAWEWTNAQAGWRYQGQGQHGLHVADIDDDGRDEILNGSIAIDNDGRIMWSTGMGHGDRFYITDVDPRRPGLEIWYSYEDPHPRNGVGLWVARTGNLIFGTDEPIVDNQVGRALVADIDPSHPGMELWADKFFYTAQGEKIGGEVPPQDDLVWWDADPLREFCSRRRISKWQGPVLKDDLEGSTMFIGDVVGDWREEIVTVADGEIRIHTTPIPATDRRVTLMQDPLYRIDVGLRGQAYPHSPMTSFFLGHE